KDFFLASPSPAASCGTAGRSDRPTVAPAPRRTQLLDGSVPLLGDPLLELRQVGRSSSAMGGGKPSLGGSGITLPRSRALCSAYLKTLASPTLNNAASPL